MNKILMKILLVGVMAVMTLSLVTLIGCDSIERHPNSDESIDAALENTIRTAYSDRTPLWYFSDTFVSRYYGTFNSASVIMMGSTENFPGDEAWYEIVAGVTFYYGDTRHIIVWHEDAFYTLPEAYMQDILTQANLQTIADTHNNR
ncbi:MAG: hypothetical protein FWE03_02725 [Firmicutes bacterium]|nr:hypothetical protein [Bacillota bacterium]